MGVRRSRSITGPNEKFFLMLTTLLRTVFCPQFICRFFCTVSTLLVVSGVSAPRLQAGTVTWIAPTDPSNSNANFPAVASTSYTANFGIAFKTGSAGPFSIDWIKLGLNTSGIAAGGSAGLSVALRNTTNTNAYSAAAGTTLYATDAVTFTMPVGTATPFDVDLTAAMLPNISAFNMSANTEYSLVLYNVSANIGMGRRTGYASQTTNNFYTTSNGFTMLNSFRNNSTYSNNPNSFPSLMISFGETKNPPAVPEPSTLALAGMATLLAGSASRLRHRKRG